MPRVLSQETAVECKFLFHLCVHVDCTVEWDHQKQDDEELNEQYKSLAKTQQDKQTLVFEDLKKTASKYKKS